VTGTGWPVRLGACRGRWLCLAVQGWNRCGVDWGARLRGVGENHVFPSWMDRRRPQAAKRPAPAWRADCIPPHVRARAMRAD
jgi:hypothetical protein